MVAKYWQRGESLDYTTVEAVVAGEVVSLNTRIGIAGENIPAGGAGSVHVVGVFEFSKGSEAIGLGADVYYDAANDVITTSDTDTVPAGYAVAAVDASTSTVLVKLLG